MSISLSSSPSSQLSEPYNPLPPAGREGVKLQNFFGPLRFHLLWQGVPHALMRRALTKTPINCPWYWWGRSSTYLHNLSISWWEQAQPKNLRFVILYPFFLWTALAMAMGQWLFRPILAFIWLLFWTWQGRVSAHSPRFIHSAFSSNVTGRFLHVRRPPHQKSQWQVWASVCVCARHVLSHLRPAKQLNLILNIKHMKYHWPGWVPWVSAYYQVTNVCIHTYTCKWGDI